jgi:hypothetical protein
MADIQTPEADAKLDTDGSSKDEQLQIILFIVNNQMYERGGFLKVQIHILVYGGKS